MKSILNIAITLFAAIGLISLSGCKDEGADNCPSDVKVESAISFSLTNNTLKAATIVQPNEAEINIESVTALLFEEGKLVTSTEPTKSGDKYIVSLDREGIFDLIVVANADANLKKTLANPNLNLSEVGSLAVQTALDGSQPLVMVTPTVNVGYAEGGKTIDAGLLTLKRLAGRIQIYNRVPGLVITNIKYLNRVEETNLEGTPKEASQLLLKEVNMEVAEGTLSTTPSAYFYTYPSPADEGAKLVVEGTLNDAPLTSPIEIELEREILSDKVYSIVLNNERAIGEELNPQDLYRDLIKVGVFVQDWSSATEFNLSDPQELTFHTPDFTVTAPDDKMTIEEGVPTVINVPADIYTFTIVTTTPNDLAEVVLDGEGTDDISIFLEKKEVDAEQNIKQTYSVMLTENILEEERTFTILVRNAYDPSLSKTIIVKQAIGKEAPGPDPDPVGGDTPLSLFAEFNVNKDGTGFTDTNANGHSGYFTYKQMIGAEPLSNGKTFTPPAGYKVPNAYELFLVLPYGGNFTDNKQLKVPGYGDSALAPILNVTEGAGYDNFVKQYSADYAFSDYSQGYKKVIYGLRFKKLTGEKSSTYGDAPAATDNKDMVAFRYEYTNNPYNPGSYTQSILIVTACKIGESQPGITISDVAKEEFWNNPAVSYDKLELPMDGYNYDASKGKASAPGMWGYYMGITTGDPNARATFGWKITGMQIKSDGFSGYYMSKCQPLRLIKGTRE